RYPQLLTANHALLISSAASDNFWQAVDAVNTRTPMPLPAPYRPAIDRAETIVSYADQRRVANIEDHLPATTTGNVYFDYLCSYQDSMRRYFDRPAETPFTAACFRSVLPLDKKQDPVLRLDVTDIWSLFPANTPLARTQTGPDLVALFNAYPLIRDSMVQSARAILVSIGYLPEPNSTTQPVPAWWNTGGLTEQEFWAVGYILHSISQIAPAQIADLVGDVSAHITRAETAPFAARLRPLLQAMVDPNNMAVPEFPNNVRRTLNLPLLQPQPPVQPLQPQPITPAAPVTPRVEPAPEQEVQAYLDYINGDNYIAALYDNDPLVFERQLPEMLSTIFPLEAPSTLFAQAPTLSLALRNFLMSPDNTFMGVTPQQQAIERWLDFCGIIYIDRATNEIRLDGIRFNQTLGSHDVTYQLQFNRILSHLSATGNLAEARSLVNLVLSLYPLGAWPSQNILNAWGVASNLVIRPTPPPTTSTGQVQPTHPPVFRPTTTQPS
ncbi:MAG: hypothetical protein ACRC9R_06880, partial [Enterovibrio sp.]